MAYRAKLPSFTLLTNRASKSTPRCFETLPCFIAHASTSSDTVKAWVIRARNKWSLEGSERIAKSLATSSTFSPSRRTREMTSTESTIRYSSPSAVKAALTESLLLDVRTSGEFSGVHIEEAVLQSLDDLDVSEVSRLCEGKCHCVVVCATGKRASVAAEKLRMAGLSNISVLEGGMAAWESAGLPVVRGKGVIPLERQVRIATGAFVLAGAILSYTVSSNWILLSGAVGAGLIFAGVTDTCGLAMLLSRMPWNQSKSCCCSAGKSCSFE